MTIRDGNITDLERCRSELVPPPSARTTTRILGVPGRRAFGSSWEQLPRHSPRSRKTGLPPHRSAPSSYQVGQEHAFVRRRLRGRSPRRSTCLAAVRCRGNAAVDHRSRAPIATLDHMLKGRLTIKNISVDFPARSPRAPTLPALARKGLVEILSRQAWTRDEIDSARAEIC